MSDAQAKPAGEVARQANRIARTALVLSTVISSLSLGFTVYRGIKDDERIKAQNAAGIIVEPDVNSQNKDNDPVYKFGNYSKIPVDGVHVIFRETATGKTVNYGLGPLPACHQIGLLVDRERLTFLHIEFTDPDGRSWRRGREEPLKEINGVNKTGGVVPESYHPDKKPSWDLTRLQFCG